MPSELFVLSHCNTVCHQHSNHHYRAKIKKKKVLFQRITSLPVVVRLSRMDMWLKSNGCHTLNLSDVTWHFRSFRPAAELRNKRALKGEPKPKGPPKGPKIAETSKSGDATAERENLGSASSTLRPAPLPLLPRGFASRKLILTVYLSTSTWCDQSGNIAWKSGGSSRQRRVRPIQTWKIFI